MPTTFRCFSNAAAAYVAGRSYVLKGKYRWGGEDYPIYAYGGGGHPAVEESVKYSFSKSGNGYALLELVEGGNPLCGWTRVNTPQTFNFVTDNPNGQYWDQGNGVTAVAFEITIYDWRFDSALKVTTAAADGHNYGVTPTNYDVKYYGSAPGVNLRSWAVNTSQYDFLAEEVHRVYFSPTGSTSPRDYLVLIKVVGSKNGVKTDVFTWTDMAGSGSLYNAASGVIIEEGNVPLLYSKYQEDGADTGV